MQSAVTENPQNTNKNKTEDERIKILKRQEEKQR